MGGDVGAESTLGVGSTFWFEIPCRAAAPVNFETSEAGDLAGSPELEGLRLMIVDDNQMNRELVRILLSPYGVVLSDADGGRAAIALAESEPFDVIVMDVRMPDIDGPTAAKAIRNGGGPNCDTPIIAFTAEANGRALPPAWTSIFDDQLPKPIVAADLLAAMQFWNPANPPQSQAALERSA